MTYLPKRSKRPKMNVRVSSVIKCPGHLKWVRGHECAIEGKMGLGPLGTGIGHHVCEGRMEAHHAHSRGAGGGDNETVPLCSKGHRNIHDGCSFDVDLAVIAAALWAASPHRRKWELEHEA